MSKASKKRAIRRRRAATARRLWAMVRRLGAIVVAIAMIAVLLSMCKGCGKVEDTTLLSAAMGGDPNNYVYPFNTMSTDWSGEIYDNGFKLYQIPEEYAKEGGCFPEVVQVYLWGLCEQRGIDYYTVVALIERESGYKWDATGDGGKSVGYMQIEEKWHKDRMLAEDVDNLCNPYGNIRVGLNFLQYLNNKYMDSSGANCVLMAYNMGEGRAKSLWKKGIYSTEYSRGVLKRAEEIRRELGN